MKTFTIAIALLLAAPLAHAQDDNATGSSGHDPNAAPKLHTIEIEGAPPAGAQATRHDHTFGVGFSQTPSGLTGVEAEYYLGGPLVLDGTLGFDVFSPKNGGTTTVIGIGAAVFYRWKVWDDVALMVGGRLEFEHLSVGDSGTLAKPQISYGGADATQINIEVPLRAQIYFASFLAVHCEVAAVLALATDDGGGILGSQSVPKGTYFSIPLTNLIGDFGVVYYFP
jgi:hypothetical protein